MQGREKDDAHPIKERNIQDWYAQRRNPDDIILHNIDDALSKIHETEQKRLSIYHFIVEIWK